MLVIERVTRQRKEARWEAVASLGARSIGLRGRDVLAGLAALYTDQTWIDDANRGDWKYAGLTPSRELKALPAWRSELSIFDTVPPLPPLDAYERPPADRLTRLIPDRAWREAAAIHLLDLREACISTLGDWAAVMVDSHTAARRADMFAWTIDALTSLRGRITRFDHAAGPVQPLVDDIVAWWHLVDAKTRLLTNACWRESRVPYTFALYPEIADCSVEDAFADRLTVGTWRPPGLK